MTDLAENQDSIILVFRSEESEEPTKKIEVFDDPYGTGFILKSNSFQVLQRQVDAAELKRQYGKRALRAAEAYFNVGTREEEILD